MSGAIAIRTAPNGTNKGGVSLLVPALLLPILALNLVAFAGPLANLFWISIHESVPTGGVGRALSSGSWAQLINDSYYVGLVWRSVWVSLVVTFFALACSYPIALYIYRSSGSARAYLMILVITPLLTSTVVRTYGWLAVLGDHGLLSAAATMFGISSMPHLMYNLTGVIIGLTEIQMPYMVLSLLVGLARVEPRFEEAAATLGASRLKIFWEVVFPLSLPGVALGSLFCFVHSVSAFVTPQVLGGGRVNLLATEIFDQASMVLNWPLAGAVSILVLVVFSVALVIYSRAAARID
jgi:putative spermidine/putrescine transport system permease protein